MKIFALAGMGLGVVFILWPAKDGLFRAGFFLTAVFTALYITATHMGETDES